MEDLTILVASVYLNDDQAGLGLIWESGRLTNAGSALDLRRQETLPRRTWRGSSITLLGYSALTRALCPIVVSDHASPDPASVLSIPGNVDSWLLIGQSQQPRLPCP